MADMAVFANNELGLSVRNKLNILRSDYNARQNAAAKSLFGNDGATAGEAKFLTASEAKAVLQYVIADIPSLQDALNAKAALSHTQSISTIIGLIDALGAKADLVDANMSGNTRADTPTIGDNSRRVATTEFVAIAIAALIDSSPGFLDTFNEIAEALGNDPDFATTMLNALAGKQPLSSVLNLIAGLTPDANKLPYFSANNAAAVTDFSAVARILIAQTTVAAMRSTLEIPNPIQWILESHTLKTPLTGNTTATDLNAGTLNIIPLNTFTSQNQKITYKFVFYVEASGASTVSPIVLTLRFNATTIATYSIPSATPTQSYVEWDVDVVPMAANQQRIRHEARIVQPNGTTTRTISARTLAAAATGVDLNVNIIGQLGTASDVITLADIDVTKQAF